MNRKFKKLDIITLMAIIIMTISIVLFNFDDFSWNTNSRSYIGLIIFVVLGTFSYVLRRKKLL